MYAWEAKLDRVLSGLQSKFLQFRPVAICFPAAEAAGILVAEHAMETHTFHLVIAPFQNQIAYPSSVL